jgi:putative pyruvate formate lyase activating enzyme
MAASYLKLQRSGELARRAKRALALLASCRLCPRGCGADRLNDERGFCGVGRKAVVASYNLHFGEEAPLVGERGSGTIFFAGCNLKCVFCQNYDISHDPTAGLEATPEQLAGVMLHLQEQGAHNINLVTPSHVAAQILEALPIAAEHGLTLPLVWNSSGFDAVKTLRLLDGVVDIYMPDAKYWDARWAARHLRGASDYPAVARAAIAEMHRQVGELALDASGVATRGLLVRHLVLPGGLAGSADWMRFLAGLSRRTYVNVMDQYRPAGEAGKFPELSRSLSAREFSAAEDAARAAGLERLDDRAARLAFRLRKLLH